jgi:plasmid maintenance system antidote protein VapI
MNLTNIERILANPSPEIQRRVELRMAILDRIHELLEQRFGGRQKDLASALGVSEPAVSKMINGYQNFELDTIVRLELALGGSILAVLSDEKDAEFIPARTTISHATMHVHVDGTVADTGYSPATTAFTLIQESKEGI